MIDSDLEEPLFSYRNIAISPFTVHGINEESVLNDNRVQIYSKITIDVSGQTEAMTEGMD